MVNDTTRLLGLEGLAVEKVELDTAGIPMVHLATADEQARCCPGCGFRAVRVKEWTTTPAAGPACRRAADPVAVA